MAFSVVEWFVLVFAIVAIVKLVVIAFSPKSWLGLAKNLYKSTGILLVVELILSAVLFYYLFMEVGIVVLMAGVVLGALLTGMTFAAYGKETIAWGTKLLNKDLLKKAWLPIIVWLALSVWVLYELFF